MQGDCTAGLLHIQTTKPNSKDYPGLLEKLSHYSTSESAHAYINLHVCTLLYLATLATDLSKFTASLRWEMRRLPHQWDYAAKQTSYACGANQINTHTYACRVFSPWRSALKSEIAGIVPSIAQCYREWICLCGLSTSGHI